MHISDRFARLWERWDAELRAGGDTARSLRSWADEDLLELLAGASSRERKYERDIVATELMNRLGRRQRSLPAVAAEVLRSAEAAYEAATEGQRAIHKAESILKANGEEALGADVSAAAYESLDTTRLAFEAAQQNSADVSATVAQSRAAQRLAAAAAQSASDAQAATAEAAAVLDAAGHEKVAAAAHRAATEMREASEATLDAARRERETEGGG